MVRESQTPGFLLLSLLHLSALLCFVAASWDMNPAIPQDFLDSERERDPEYFDREYGAIFSDAITSAFSREAVEACVIPGRFELPYIGEFHYVAGVDPSGGGADEFALLICHREKDRIVQDCIRALRSRRPDDVVGRYCQFNGCWAVLARPDEPIPPLSKGTRRLSPVTEGSVTEESIVNCFEMVPTDPE